MVDRVEALEIGTKVDDTGFNELEKQAVKSFNTIAKEVKSLNTELESLSKEREILVKQSTQTEETKKRIEELDKQIASLTTQKEIKLQLNKAQFETAKKNIKDLALNVAKLSLAVAAVGTAFGVMLIKLNSSLDVVGKLSQKLGLSTEKFQQLSYIAETTGTNIEMMSMVMRTLVNSAADGNKAFAELGISVKDANGNFKTQEELFFEVVKRLQGMEAGTKRTKLAFDLLGRGALELAPLLNEGVGSIEAMSKRVRELGGIIDEKSIKSAEKLDDLITDLKVSFTAVLYNILIPLTPVLVQITNNLITLGVKIQALAKEYMPSIIKGLETLREILPYLLGILGSYVAAVVAVNGATIAAALANGVLTASFKALAIAMFATPVGQITLLLSGLSAALIYAYKNWDKLSTNIEYGTAILLTYFEKLTSYIRTAFFSVISGVGTSLIAVFDAILATISVLPSRIGDMADVARTKLKDLQDNVKEWETLKAESERTDRENADNEITRLNELRKARLQALEDQKNAQKETTKVIEETAEKMTQLNTFNAEDFKKKLADLEKGYQAELLIADKTIENAEELSAKKKEIDKTYYEEKLKILNELARAEFANNKTISDSTIQQMKDTLDSLKGLVEEKSESIFVKIGKFYQDNVSQLVGSVQNIATSYFDFLNTTYDAEIRAIQSRYEAETDILDAQLEENKSLKEKYNQDVEDLNWKMSESATQAEYQALEAQKQIAIDKYNAIVGNETDLNNKKQELAKKQAIEEAKLERKKAENQKAQSMINAIINIAEGVSKAWAQGGAILGPAFAALVAAAGAIQIATIAKQPLPEIPSYHEGGTIGQANDKTLGVKSPNRHDKTLIWAQENEEVLPVSEAELYRKMLKDNGYSLADLPAILNKSGAVDNSNTIVNQSVNFEVKETLSFVQARYAARKIGIEMAKAIRV